MSQKWISDHIFVSSNLVQVVAFVILVSIGSVLGKRWQHFLKARFKNLFYERIYLSNFLHTTITLLPTITTIILISLGIVVAGRLKYPAFFLTVVDTLLVVWVIVKLATTVILDHFWSKLISASAWILAAMSILGILTPSLVFLEHLSFTIGNIHLTVLSILKGVIVLFVLLWFGTWFSDYTEGKLKNISYLSPSNHVLASKIIKITIFAIIFVLALDSIGVDLTTLAVFSGAIGVGVGFGLQRVAANLISGIILLVDKSIKPGDVIQLGDIYGWIIKLGGRYVSVRTRDGTEYLIPNEDLITHQVINLSFSDTNVRLKIPFGISYKSDPHKAIDLVLVSTKNVERVLQEPEPKCLLVGFGDSSVDFEFRFWINDPQNGIGSVKSEILLNMWDIFIENDIQIPFPQRDIHLDIQSLISSIKDHFINEESNHA